MLISYAHRGALSVAVAASSMTEDLHLSEAGIGVPDARGKFSEGPGRAGMTIRAKEHFAGPRVAFLGKGDVTDAFIAGSADIVEVFDVLLGREVPQDFQLFCLSR